MQSNRPSKFNKIVLGVCFLLAACVASPVMQEYTAYAVLTINSLTGAGGVGVTETPMGSGNYVVDGSALFSSAQNVTTPWTFTADPVFSAGVDHNITIAQAAPNTAGDALTVYTQDGPAADMTNNAMPAGGIYLFGGYGGAGTGVKKAGDGATISLNAGGPGANGGGGAGLPGDFIINAGGDGTTKGTIEIGNNNDANGAIHLAQNNGGIKIGFWGHGETPGPIQPVNDATVIYAGGGASAVYADTRFNGGLSGPAYTTGDLVMALKKLGILE